MRTLRSELVWVAVPGPQPWGVVPRRRRARRPRARKRRRSPGEALREPAPTAVEQARGILEESSRYNLGARRDVNVPTLALLWLLPENRHRLEFERKGERTIANLHGVEVEFREVASPTLVRDSGGIATSPRSAASGLTRRVGWCSAARSSTWRGDS